MHDVKVVWLSHSDGGRKSPPPDGQYFAVASFPEDGDWQYGVWSVVFELQPFAREDSKLISYGKVRFLVDDAPQERMINNDKFDIYEGPHRVASVLLRPNPVR